MNAPRKFHVCRGCGTWREFAAHDLKSYLADIDMAFFMEGHAVCCPVTGRGEGVTLVREDDPGYVPLSPDKLWRPEILSLRRNWQDPKYYQYRDDLARRVPGVWCDRASGAFREVLVLSADGDGILDFWNFGSYCGRRNFRWNMDGADHICFHGTENYFKKERARIEIGLDFDGIKTFSDRLTVFDGDTGEKPAVFSKAKRSVEEYRKIDRSRD
jgi:hypothetical protein